jgi:hypothetical protein
VLSDPTFDAGVAPNVDTLYSVAWLDLDDEPFVLEAPDFGSRYYTFQLANGDGSCDLSVGSRTHGARLPPVFIAGPRHDGGAPDGMIDVRSTTRFFMIAGRILLRPAEPADLARVHELQRSISLRPLGKLRASDTSAPNGFRTESILDAPADADPELRFLHELGNVLRDWVVTERERPLVESFAAIGLTPERGFDPTAGAREAVVRGLGEGAALVEERSHNLGENANGWTTNYVGPRFGDDYLLRSAVAKDQIYVTVPEEALYPVAAFESDGARLTGEHAYTITFAPGELPPVDAFWSLTMYSRNPPLVANPIERYAIGDRTAGLSKDADGSLVVRIQHEQPCETAVNWLPAPAGPFHLMLRLYVPRPAALDGSWVPPPVERL